MHNFKLEQIINIKLNNGAIQDGVPNGLQIEGRQEIHRILTGVTICQSLIDKALTYKADAIIVHHGLFWHNESSIIKGIKYKRIKTLLENNINLYAWHLPLDIHPNVGNNAQLALNLDIKIMGNLSLLVFYGEFINAISAEMLQKKLQKIYKSTIIHFGDNASLEIKKIAWCTGKGPQFLELAAMNNMDAFITGEISEPTIHIAREYGLHFYAIGHHATERGGIISLGKWLNQQYDLEVIFIDIPNPA